MKDRVIHVCSFDAVEELGKRPSYEKLKAAVLRAGKFSCFEASDTVYLGNLYTRLCRDPEIERFDLPYPWTGIRKREDSREKS